MTKFSSQIDDKLFLELRTYSEKNRTEISVLLEEAVRDLLIKKRLSPACKKSADDIFKQYESAMRTLSQ